MDPQLISNDKSLWPFLDVILRYALNILPDWLYWSSKVIIHICLSFMGEWKTETLSKPFFKIIIIILAVELELSDSMTLRSCTRFIATVVCLANCWAARCQTDMRSSNKLHASWLVCLIDAVAWTQISPVTESHVQPTSSYQWKYW